MTAENKHALRFGFALIIVGLVFYYLWKKEMAGVIAAETPATNQDFQGIFNSPTSNGWPPGQEPAGFQSTINVSVQNPLLGALAQQYIPVFGLVGMTAVGE